MRSTSVIKLVPPVAGCILALACASTQVVDAWKAPNARELKFDKVVAVAISSDETFQRIAEDKMAEQIRRTQAAPGFSVLNEEDRKNPDVAKRKIEEAGFDGIVTMRLVSADDKLTYIPGSPRTYGGFWGFYGYAAPAAYSPGYIQQDKVVRVETKVYDLKSDQLLWSGLSETFNPTSANHLVDDVARAVGKELHEEGLLR